jgi:hypothetical protein
MRENRTPDQLLRSFCVLVPTVLSPALAIAFFIALVTAEDTGDRGVFMVGMLTYYPALILSFVG